MAGAIVSDVVQCSVSAHGGIYVHKDREVPDTYATVIEYPKFYIEMSGSMACAGLGQYHKQAIYGHKGTLVIDVAQDHNTRETARRVAKMYVNEVFRGRYIPPPKVTEFPNSSHLNELMIMGPITVRSACSHHLCPIMGKLWIGVMPNADTNLIGLSKYSRIADWVM